MAERGKRQPVRIFVSHSHKDDAFGRRLVGDLRAVLGEDSAVWYDASGGLRGGDAWWRMIVRELTARPVFIVVLSPDALASPWVNDEIDLAWKQKNSPAGKLILPVICRPCTLREDLTLLQHVSFVAPRRYEDGLAAVLAALGLPPAPPAPASAPLDAAIAPAQASDDSAPLHDALPADAPISQHDVPMPTPASPITPASTAAGAPASAPGVAPSTHDVPAATPMSASPRRQRPSHPRWRPSARVLAVLLAASVLLVAGTAGLANATGALKLFAGRPTTHATHGPSPTATATATRGPTPTPTLVLPSGFIEFDGPYGLAGMLDMSDTYRIAYPAGWAATPLTQVTPPPPLYSENFTPPATTTSGDLYPPFFQVNQSTGWGTQTDEALFNNYYLATANSGTFSKQTLDGVTCSRGDELHTTPGATEQLRALICRHSGVVYLFYMQSNALTFAQADAQYFEPMLASFQFLPL